MKIAVCDDEEIFINNFKLALASFCSGSREQVELCEYTSGQALLEACKDCDFDAVFLDIRLPELDGWEISRRLRENGKELIIVFMSGYAEYIPHAFTHRAFSFLIKPFVQKDFDYVFEKVVEEYHFISSEFYSMTIARTNIKLKLADIQYFDVLGRVVTAHTEKKSFKHYAKLNDLELTLGKKNFVRCHKSFIVNMRYIHCIDTIDVTLSNGARVPLSKHKRGYIKQRYLLYKNGEVG